MACNSTSAVNHGQILPKTSSRCSSERVTATHDFEVANYSLLDGMGVSKFVRSSTFSVGGYDWCISFYPDGEQDDCTGNASAFLDYLSSAKNVRTTFKLNVLVKDEIKKNLIAVPQPNLQDHLRKMWKDGEGADVATFSVSGELFNAHRCLLAELFGPMKEKTPQCIKIDDIEPLIFEALLHFIYTDSMLEDDEHWKEGNTANLQHLLVAADRYGVERLKVICESKLSESIDVETVATTLVLAEQHHCSELREACIEFIASRNMLAAVMATEGFNHLVATCSSVMEDILAKVSQGF